MQTYSKFRPTSCDPAGLNLDDQQDWLVLPCSRNRDSGPLDESNFACTLKSLGGECDDVQVHRFGHWACGWFEIIIVRPDSAAATEAEEIETALSDYPVLDDSDYSEREQAAANETWQNCYNTTQRIEYMRDNASQFEFRSFADMLGCARGNYFAGYASELIGD